MWCGVDCFGSYDAWEERGASNFRVEDSNLQEYQMAAIVFSSIVVVNNLFSVLALSGIWIYIIYQFIINHYELISREDITPRISADLVLMQWFSVFAVSGSLFYDAYSIARLVLI